MSFKAWLSIITLTLVGVIIFFSRHELLHAWHLLGHVNLWILLLLIPGQILVYYIAGEMVFSYLREKGAIQHIPASDLTRMSLEMNFVNHVLPTGGVSGISYMAWRLGKYGVPSGRATVAQMVRFTMTFVAYIALLLVAVLVVTIDGNINRWIIFVSSTLVLMTVVVVVATVYVLSGRERMWRFGSWLVRTSNRLVKKITFGRRKAVLRYSKVEKFFTDIHFDYLALRRDMRILLKPFLWGIVFTLADVSLFLITFWAMGSPVNPAPVLIAYGVATTAGLLVATPGGAGAYEAVMVGFLALAGLDKSTAIAGIVLTRVILLLGTIILGYAFYQNALFKYGKQSAPTSHR